jgi:TetR/AcrR family transcriptional regulator, fatty acid metabolism regulator protein
MNDLPQTDTQQKILDAAIDVFAQKGYHDTRVDEIVDASKTSKGAVYFYFPSKQDIFLAIVDKFAGLLEERLTPAIAQESSGVERVSIALHVCLKTFEQYRSLAKVFLVQAAGLGVVFEDKQIEIHNRFARLIQQQLDDAVREGDIPPIDTEVAAYIWMGAIYNMVIRWVRTGKPEPSRIFPTLQVMLLRSIGVPEERIRSLERSFASR